MDGYIDRNRPRDSKSKIMDVEYVIYETHITLKQVSRVRTIQIRLVQIQ